jgi:hypothetical protein
MDRIEKAKQILQTCREAGITVAIRPVLKPAARVTPEIEADARDLADELLELKIAEQGSSLCARCHRLQFATPAQEVAAVRELLMGGGEGVAWSTEAIARLKARMRQGERIVRIDGPGYHVVIERPDGSLYHLDATTLDGVEQWEGRNKHKSE